MWSFLVGHFAGWTIGTLFSIGGIVIALLSTMEALNRLERSLSQSPHNSPNPKPRSLQRDSLGFPKPMEQSIENE